MALKDIPEKFDINSEEDLRLAVCEYFKELGFGFDELSTEDTFTIKLGHSDITKKSAYDKENKKLVNGRSDVLLTRNGNPLAIIEVKNIDHKINDDDRDQAISYARLLKKIAPFSIVTNGRNTIVYDTITTEPIDSPNNSIWCKHGQNLLSIEEDILYDAMRQIIGLDKNTFTSFCRKQINNSLSDLKGNVQDQRKYIPSIYVHRTNLDYSFNEWLTKNEPVFAVIGESGFGKTNFMCSKAEEKQEEYFTLFFSASRLIGGLYKTLENEFVWEFQREKNISYFLHRIQSLCNKHGKKVIVFIDGLDEFPGNLVILRNEIMDICSRISYENQIRICVSCKSYDWPIFVIDNNQSYNNLALAIFPFEKDSKQPFSVCSPKAENVGFQIKEYTNEELKTAIDLYTRSYSYMTNFSGDLQKECKNPLMLRFISEVYSGTQNNLPSSITSKELFNLYWERKVEIIPNNNIACEILKFIAEKCFSDDSQRVLVDEIVKNVNCYNEQVLDNLCRLGILQINIDENKYPWVNFYFGKLLFYTYFVKTRRWPLLSNEEIISEISVLVQKYLGREGIGFYFSVFDHGESDILTKIIEEDIITFLTIIEDRNLEGFSSMELEDSEKSKSLENRLFQYADSYSKIRSSLFSKMAEKTEPFYPGEVGILTNLKFVVFRKRTKIHPEVITYADEETSRSFFDGTLPERRIRELLPGSKIKLGLFNLLHEVPQKIAWEECRDQITKIIKNQLLDESNCPIILQERIWNAINNSPSYWLPDMPLKHLLELLGFNNRNEIQEIKLSEISERVTKLIIEFQKQIPLETNPKYFNNSQRWYFYCIQDLYILRYWIILLQNHKDYLDAPLYKSEDLFSYLSTGNLNDIRSILSSLIPKILHEYEVLFKSNFPDLLKFCPFFSNINRVLAIEINKDNSGIRSDYLDCSYIVSTKNTYENFLPEVLINQTEIINNIQWLKYEKFGITWESSYGNYGTCSLNLSIQGKEFSDSHMIINRIKIPSNTFIVSQIYQLISNELGHIFFNDSEFSMLFSSSLNKEKFLQWMIFHFS